MRKGWVAGRRVAIRVSGVDLECEIPAGVERHGAFFVRVARDRLPPLLAYAPRDFDDPLSTVHARDLERLHSLVAAAEAAPGDAAEALGRAATLARTLLAAPLLDARDHESRKTYGSSRRRSTEARPPPAPREADPDAPPPPLRLATTRRGATGLPFPHYRGADDEASAERAAASLDEAPWDELDRDARSTAPWSAPAGGDEAPADDRRAPDSYARLVASEANADAAAVDASDARADWRDELRDFGPVRDALRALAALADRPPPDDGDADGGDDDVDAISDGELRRALTTLGPRPLSQRQVSDLLAVAVRGGAALGKPDDANRDGERRPGSATARYFDGAKLARVISVDHPRVTRPKPEACRCVRRWCCCKRAHTPEHISVSV